LTETCDDNAPNLNTHVATTPATTADCDLTAAIHTDLAAKQLLPSEHYLDIGYIEAELLVRSQSDHQVRLVGPVSSDPAWQAHTPNGITLTQFGLDWEAPQAVCPEGKLSRWWSEEQDADGNATVVIRFGPEDCRVCARHSECTKAKKGARGLRLRPREQHEAIQAAHSSTNSGVPAAVCPEGGCGRHVSAGECPQRSATCTLYRPCESTPSASAHGNRAEFNTRDRLVGGDTACPYALLSICGTYGSNTLSGVPA
jgi:hypothetical protein